MHHLGDEFWNGEIHELPGGGPVDVFPALCIVQRTEGCGDPPLGSHRKVEPPGGSRGVDGALATREGLGAHSQRNTLRGIMGALACSPSELTGSKRKLCTRSVFRQHREGLSRNVPSVRDVFLLVGIHWHISCQEEFKPRT